MAGSLCFPRDLDQSFESLTEVITEIPRIDDPDPLDFSYGELIQTITTYFEDAEISSFQKRVLFAAYAPLHQNFISYTFVSGLEGVLPFSSIWLTFSRTYDSLNLGKFYFDPLPFLNPIGEHFIKHELVSERAIFDAFCACFGNVKIFVDTKEYCAEAISSFRAVLESQGIPALLRNLYLFECHYRSFLCRRKLNKLIKKVDRALLTDPIFPPSSDSDERSREILGHLTAFSILAVRIVLPDTESFEGLRFLRQFSLLLLCESPDHGSGFFKALQDALSPLVRFRISDDVGSLLELTNFFATLPSHEWRVSDRFAKFLRIREQFQTNCIELRPLYTLFSALVEFLAAFGAPDSCAGLIHRLVASYAGAVIQACLREEVDTLTCYRSQILVRPDATFGSDLEALTNAIQELITSRLLNPMYRSFFQRFLIYLKILASLFSALPSPTVQKIKPDMLRFFPDVRKIGHEYTILPDVQVLINKFQVPLGEGRIGSGTFANAADAVFDYGMEVCSMSSIQDVVDEMRKIAVYEMQLKSFFTRHVTDPPARPLLEKENSFAQHLRIFLEAIMPIIQDRSISNVTFGKLCFDLSLCIMFTDYANPGTVADRWQETLRQLAVPIHPRSIFDWIRFDELYEFLEKSGHVRNSSGLVDKFGNDMIRFLTHPSNANVSAFKATSEQLARFLGPTQPQCSFRSVLAQYEMCQSASEKMAQICRLFYSNDPDIAASCLAGIILGNLIHSIYRTLAFALGEGLLLRQSEQHVQAFLSSAAGYWPRKTRCLHAITHDLLERLYPMFQGLRGLSFVDMRPFVTTHVSFLATFVIAQANASPHFDPKHPWLVSLEDAIAIMNTSQDLWTGLLEALRWARSLEQELRASQKREDIKPIMNPVVQFCHYILDCLSVMSFERDLVVCLNAFAHAGELVGCQFRQFPIAQSRFAPSARPMGFLEERPEVRSLIEMLQRLLTKPAAFSTFCRIETILCDTSTAKLAANAQSFAGGCKKVNNELSATLARLRSLRDLQFGEGPDAAGVIRGTVEKAGQAADLEWKIEVAQRELDELDAEIAELEERLGRRPIPLRRNLLLGVCRRIEDEAGKGRGSESEEIMKQVKTLQAQNAKLRGHLQRKRVLNRMHRVEKPPLEDVQAMLLDELQDSHMDIKHDVRSAILFVAKMTDRKVRAVRQEELRKAIDSIELFAYRLVEQGRRATEAREALRRDLVQLRGELTQKATRMAEVINDVW
jgi:hypothetical protein